MSYLEHTQNFSTFMEVLLRDPERYLPVVQLRDRMTRNFAELSWAECELIGVEISKANQSEFCTGIRKGLVKALEVNKGNLVNKKLQAAIDFALKINKRAADIDARDIDRLREAGWSDQTIEDIIGLVAMTKVYNTLAIGLGFKGVSDEKFAQIGQATVAKQGYEPFYLSILKQSG